MKIILQLTLIFVLLFSGSCSEELTTTPLGTFDAVVTGMVMDNNNNPVNRATVLVGFNFTDCSDSSFISAGITESDFDGMFQRRIFHPVKKVIKCLKLTASTPDGNQPGEVIVTKNVSIELKVDDPVESVNIDVQF